MSLQNSEWIFLRGLTRERAHWLDFPETFEKLIPQSHVTCLDLPGTGENRSTPCPKSIIEITDWLRAKLPPSNNKRKLLAISMGAMVGIDWISRYTEDFCAAAFINPSFSELSPFIHRLRPQNWVKVLAAALLQGKSREKLILEMTSRKKERFESLAERFAAIQRERPVSRLTFLNQFKAAASFRPPENLPDFPILLLNSSGDELVNPVCSTHASLRWELPLTNHPWAGHDLTLDDPEWVINEILSFLS